MGEKKRQTDAQEVHTELRAHDVEKARAADAKRNTQPNVLPKTMSDDALDDLFNDMPV